VEKAAAAAGMRSAPRWAYLELLLACLSAFCEKQRVPARDTLPPLRDIPLARLTRYLANSGRAT